MVFTGRNDWTATGQIGRLPNNGFLLVGEDAKYYAAMYVASTSGSALTLQVKQAGDTNVTIGTRTRNEVLADGAALTGTPGNYKPHSIIPIIGTQYVGVLLGSTGAIDDFITCPIYKVDNAGALVLSGGFAYKTSSNMFNLSGTGDTGIVAGVVVVGTEVYFLVSCRLQQAPIDGIRWVLAHAPYTGTNVDLSSGSWNARVTASPFDKPFIWPFAGGGRTHYNRCTLIDRGGGLIELLKLVDQAHIDTNNTPGVPGSAIIDPLTVEQIFSCVYDTVAQTAPTLNNFSSLFGAPWSDVRKFSDGSVSGDIHDDYVDASAIGTEIIWPRGFTDQPDLLRLRRVDYHTTGVAPDVLGLNDISGFTITEFDVALEGGSAARVGVDGDLLQGTIRDKHNLYFLEVDLPLSPEEPVEPPTIVYPPTTEVDTVDELPEADEVIELQRWLLRTGHIREWGEIAIDDLRVTIKRGVGDTDFAPQIWVRANRDNRGLGKWVKRGLGKKGDRVMTLYFGGFGTARDWQFEFATTDVCEIELRKAEIMPTELGF